MALRIVIRPCWSYTCGHCGRVFRFPTSKSAGIGTAQIADHLTTHNLDGTLAMMAGLIEWKKDHWGWFGDLP